MTRIDKYIEDNKELLSDLLIGILKKQQKVVQQEEAYSTL